MLLSLIIPIFLSSYMVDAQISVPEPIPSRNFTQKVYHDKEDSATFNHSYQLDKTHFVPGGPILFYQNAENPEPIGEGGGITTHFFQDIAEELGAMTVCLEHRYFGTSFPEGFADENPSDYDALTLDNVIQDAVSLIEHLKDTVEGAEESKVIASGGSYAGFLVTMFRIRAPDTFFGAVPLSPPLKGFGPFENKTGKYEFNDWVSNVWFDRSYEAATKIQGDMTSFDQCVTDGDCSELLGFCQPAPNATELALVYKTLVNHYQQMAEFNYGVELQYPADIVDIVTNKTLEATTEQEVLRIPMEIGLNSSGSDNCFNWSSTGLAVQLAGLVTNSWLAILCDYFPHGRASREGSLFPPKDTTGRLECDLPEEWFEGHYGISPEALNKVERLLIVNGLDDPVTADSLLELELSSNRNHSRVATFSGMAHTESSYITQVYPRGIRPSVDAARNLQKEYIKAWLGFRASQ